MDSKIIVLQDNVEQLKNGIAKIVVDFYKKTDINIKRINFVFNDASGGVDFAVTLNSEVGDIGLKISY